MPCFTIGLDLGQSRDPSVLTVVERVEQRSRDAVDRFDGSSREAYVDHFFVRHLQRFEIGTSYTAIVEDVGRLLATPELTECCVLRFDATGVGRAVADMFRDAHRAGRMGSRWPEAYTLTGGMRSTGGNLAKVDLVGALQRVLQERRLHVPEELPGSSKLKQELTDFTAKITAAGRDSYEAATESAHDDHVIAVGLAVVRPSRVGWPRLLSGDGSSIVDDATADW